MARDLTQPKEASIIKEEPEGGEDVAPESVKRDGVLKGYDPIDYRKHESLKIAGQVYEGTMAAQTTVLSAAQAFYDWLISD